VQWADQRVERLSRALADSIPGWRFEPAVQALLALRGVDVVTAIGPVAEIGDLSRFEHPRKLMGYLGLVPSEHSSGEQLRRGSITKTGNGHARRLLIVAAWNYRFKPRIGRRAHQRQQGLAEPIQALIGSRPTAVEPTEQPLPVPIDPVMRLAATIRATLEAPTTAPKG